MDRIKKWIYGFTALLFCWVGTIDAQDDSRENPPVYSSAYFEYDTVRQYIRFKKDSVLNYTLYDKNMQVIRKGASKDGTDIAACSAGIYYFVLNGPKKPTVFEPGADNSYLLRKSSSPPFKSNPDKIENITLFDKEHPVVNRSEAFEFNAKDHLVSFKNDMGSAYWLYDKKGNLVQKGLGKILPVPVGEFYLILKDPRDLFPDGKMDPNAKGLFHYMYRIRRD